MTPARAFFLSEPSAGLFAWLILDDLTLGPAAGGIRTWRYARGEDALLDAGRLARAMTVKCALAGLAAGGGKLVVVDHPRLDRRRAFRALGERLARLDGVFHTAGDLGTTAEDLAAAAEVCPFVHTGEEIAESGGPGLADAVGLTVAAGMRAALGLGVAASLAGVRVAVQGAGTIGSAVARQASAAGAAVLIADVDHERAASLVAEVRARGGTANAVAASGFPAWAADVLAPCAVGQVLDEESVDRVGAKAVVPGANEVFTSVAAEARLTARGVVSVPDVLSSSGAVIVGIARTVMRTDPAPLLGAVGETVRSVLDEVAATRALASKVVLRRAAQRIDDAGGLGWRLSVDAAEPG